MTGRKHGGKMTLAHGDFINITCASRTVSGRTKGMCKCFAISPWVAYASYRQDIAVAMSPHISHRSLAMQMNHQYCLVDAAT